MKENHWLPRKQAAIVTNNLHCERHFQYFATLEKYFKLNGWCIADHFHVNKIVICACGFHDAMYEKILRTLEEIKKTNFLEKNIILMACLTKTHKTDIKSHFKGEIVELHCEEELDRLIGASVPFCTVPAVNRFNIPDRCRQENRDMIDDMFYIKISEGCLRECTFCVINKAKGALRSFPPDSIGSQVKKALEQERKKIKLMGEDTFAYGIDIGTDIIRLVEYITAMAPGIELYFGYLHIRWLEKYSNEILSLCKRGVLTELHIGLQHINEGMLKRMGRPVVFSKIYDIIRRIKKECPGFYFVGDILVGFPGETDEIFNQLVEFFQKDKCFDKIKHFGYSDVKGAPSGTFENKVPQDTITERWNRLDEILGERSYSHQVSETRCDNETFRLTRFYDYTFCKNTYHEEIEEKVSPAKPGELAAAGSTLQEEDRGDFGF